MYERITGEDPYVQPMRIYPAVHYTMGGLWVDYNLMSNVPGLYVLGEANFSDHGANRLGASRAHAGPRRRLLRAPGDHRRLPRPAARASSRCRSTTRCSSRRSRASTDDDRPPARRSTARGTVDWFHRELGKIMWDNCGMARSRESLEKALGEIPRAPRGVLERRPGPRRRRPRSTSRSRRPAGSPTSSSSASCSAATPSTARRAAAATSGVEHQTEEGEALARRRATSRTSRPGSTRRPREPEPPQGSSSSSRTSTSPSARTSRALSGFRRSRYGT